MSCAVEGCERAVLIKSRGLCRAHYKRWLRHGDPTAGTAGNHEPMVERIRRYIEPDVIGCWNWTRARNSQGYGIIGKDNTSRLAHRESYLAFVGPIPEGTELDHLCKNKGCVNPDHLEPVSRAENVRRGWPERKRRADLSHRS